MTTFDSTISRVFPRLVSSEAQRGEGVILSSEFAHRCGSREWLVTETMASCFVCEAGMLTSTWRRLFHPHGGEDT